MEQSKQEKKRVLLVESSENLAAAVIAALTEIGYQLSYASGSESGYQIATSQEAFDLIVVGNNLHSMKGPALIAELRKLDVYKLTPIIMLTASQLKITHELGMRAGASAVVKSHNGTHLLKRAVEHLLKSVRSDHG